MYEYHKLYTTFASVLSKIYIHSPSARVCISDTTCSVRVVRSCSIYYIHIYIYIYIYIYVELFVEGALDNLYIYIYIYIYYIYSNVT